MIHHLNKIRWSQGACSLHPVVTGLPESEFAAMSNMLLNYMDVRSNVAIENEKLCDTGLDAALLHVDFTSR